VETESEKPKRALAAAVDEARLWRRHMDLARIGATGNGGVDRQALTPEDNEARRVMLRWAGELGLTCALDAAGNLFIRREGRDAAAAPVMTGSHLDTQPTGGRFDGIYGVLAGFEVLQAMSEQGIRTRRPIEVVVWCNEEGCRFVPACTGSRAFTEPAELPELLQARDLDGALLGDEIEALLTGLPELPRRELGREVAAFVEAHIEQGPLLEQSGKTIGVVTGIQGARDFRVEVRGEAAHAGTTPRRLRKDAVKAAAATIVALHEFMESEDEHDLLRFTIGQLVVAPNSPSVVPDLAAFTIDFRHPDDDVLRRLGDEVEAVCRRTSGPCAVTVEETRWRRPAVFESAIPDLIERTTGELGISCQRMPSGASHDAVYLNRVCRTGMIFVPCEGGVSHNEAENAAPGDLADGARVLGEVLLRLAEA
jgi:N-carbamoyl-L-amino-acid hydrolase